MHAYIVDCVTDVIYAHGLFSLRLFTLSAQVLSFALKHAQAHKHYGRALKILYKQLDDKASKDNENKLIEVSKLFSIVHVRQRNTRSSSAKCTGAMYLYMRTCIQYIPYLCDLRKNPLKFTEHVCSTCTCTCM